MIDTILHFLGLCGDSHSHTSLSDIIVSLYSEDGMVFKSIIYKAKKILNHKQ